MALPPRGDPRRPLQLAIRSTRLLGIIFLLFGSCTFFPLLMMGRNAMPGGLILEATMLLIYIVPGAAYLVFSIFLKRRRFWAVVAAIVLASLQLLLTLFAVSSLVIFSLNRPNAISMVPLVIIGLVILALAQLIYHLSLSFESIKYSLVEEQHGFEPLMAQPIDPQSAAEEDKGL